MSGSTVPRLHAVRAPEPPAASPAPAPAPASGGDLAFLAWLLAIALVPLAGRAAGAPFGPGEAGLGTAVGLLAGREALAEARALLRRRRA